MICKQCGTENKNDAQICSKCGFVLDNDEAMFSANEQTIDSEAAHKQAQISEIQKRRDLKRKQKQIRKIALIVFIILLFAGVVFGALYLSGKQDERISDATIQLSTPAPTQTSAPTETPEPSESPEPTLSPEPTVSPKPTVSPEPTASPEATLEVVATSAPTKKPEKTKAPTKSPEKTAVPTVKPTQKPKATPKPTPKPTPTPKPVNNPKLNSTVVVVNGTTTDNDGNIYITANTNGKNIYLLPSATVIEANSYTVVNAKDTGKKVNNIPVYSVESAKGLPKGEFLIEDSSFRLLTEADIEGFNSDQIKIARNEIYARHGRQFKDDSLNAYFSAKSWYKVNPDYNYKNDVLNITETENKNAHFLLDAERRLNGQ